MISGLILCGGSSSRMGIPKYDIPYHGYPQWLHSYKLLQNLCEKVFVSCTADQSGLFAPYPTIIDKFKNMGPMAALLSAIAYNADTDWLLLGCDYPNLVLEDLRKLVVPVSPYIDVVCYRNPETDLAEPLLARYNRSSFAAIRNAHQNNQMSPRKLLDALNTKILLPEDSKHLKSFDYPSERDEWFQTR